VQEALFQLGTIYERRGATDPAQLEQAAKTFEMLLNKVPGDPNLCSRLGVWTLHRHLDSSQLTTVFMLSYRLFAMAPILTSPGINTQAKFTRRWRTKTRLVTGRQRRTDTTL
jgi:hypothetical protein